MTPECCYAFREYPSRGSVRHRVSALESEAICFNVMQSCERARALPFLPHNAISELRALLRYDRGYGVARVAVQRGDLATRRECKGSNRRRVAIPA